MFPRTGDQVSVHEFTSFRFKPGFDRDAQFGVMAEVEPVMLAQDGLELREAFYSERDDSWVSHLVWVDDEAIDAATVTVEADPHAIALFDHFDLESMRYARFEAVASATPTT
jgi:hypothetical protein